MDVLPDKQNLNSVFSGSRFSIDFYQRDYKWTYTPVARLLDDIFVKFNEAYKEHSDLPPSHEFIQSHYPWYYLNTYVTNKADGKVFIVDGQQRLTTLSLMAITLLHLATEYNSKLIGWIDERIAGSSGFKKQFWMDHEGHRETQTAIYEDKIDSELSNLGITSKNMVANFVTIKNFFRIQLDSQHKLETFIFYFLERLILIELSVEQTDVPMVFEVINDRGVRLAPYEIVKGKLLGQIKKDLLYKNKYNDLWDDRISSINKYSENESDIFFRNYFKAKFADSRSEAQHFDGDYHREIFTNEFQERLRLSRNPEGVLNFLEGPFKYFSQLYIKCLKESDSNSESGFLYNKAVDIDGASMLVMSSCFENDPEEKQKLEQIPLELDRLFSLLQLQGAYDSNGFQEILYRVSAGIRGEPATKIREVFDLHLKNELERRRNSEIESTFNYRYFRQIGDTLNRRFKRYVLARVEEFFAEHLNKKMAHPIYDLTWKTGAKDGFHVEHILSKNPDNIALFDNEDDFEIERNRLGGLLLLKGKDNISSSNETFSKKLKTYAGSLLWNETLTSDFSHANNDFKDLNNKFDLSLEAMSEFGPKELEERQKILFKIAEQIWK